MMSRYVQIHGSVYSKVFLMSSRGHISRVKLDAGTRKDYWTIEFTKY